MGVELSHLQELYLGRRDMLLLGHLPDDIAAATGVRHPIIYLSTDSIRHILERHPDITFENMLMLSDVVRRGEIILEDERGPKFLFLYWSVDHQRPYSMAVKCVGEKCELLVVSFRRTHKPNVKQLRKRGPTIRAHGVPLVL